jgi:Cdc6-like AAA superfamily ATPase
MARDDILSKLDNCFSPRDTKGKPRREFLLHGMGGVGKTQIALKAADDFEERYVARLPSVPALTLPSLTTTYLGSNTSFTSMEQPHRR